MIWLGIETSCDDTAASVLEQKKGATRVVAHIHYSQIPVHARFGGVIPEIAAREHAVTILPTIQTALRNARIAFTDIDRIAVTAGPGLAPALSVGVDTARILSQLFSIPVVPVNHIEGHIASVWPCAGIPESPERAPRLPAVALVVSGGHTELLRVARFGSYTLLGKTRDDAAGEAFDKVAALLGLPYPGGPEIHERAQHGNRRAVAFPRPMLNDPTLDFSFAGLKTAVRYAVQKQKRKTRQYVADISASFEQAVVDVLVEKTRKAAVREKAKSVLVVGGVSANRFLRKTMAIRLPQAVALHLAPPKLTGDNATMIALAACLSGKKGSTDTKRVLDANPRWELGR